MCDERGALLIFDEIQCGMGRLGPLFAFEQFGVRPDVVTLAKALANGLPIGAHARGRALRVDALQPGDHGTTFGGSPVPCAAALAHLRVRDAIDLDANVKTVGALLLDGLRAIAAEYPQFFSAPRGRGLMLGLPVRPPHEAATFATAAREGQHLLINAAGENTLRFVPPLVLSQAQARDGLARLRKAIAGVA